MATASLGRLTLDLVAKVAGYTEPLSRAERETKKSTKAITDSFDLASLAVKGFGVVLGGLSVGSVIAYSEKVITAGNDIQRFAKLANASVGQFQYYAKGAETAGISLESFADKMKDMQDRIGDFQQTGGGPLADFFTNIAPLVGVSIQQFQKLSGPEALQLFYNSLEKAGASTNDMKFYMESVISDSSLLIPLLEKNGQGFKYWGDAAEKAGAIMSNDMVNSLTEAKKNLQLMDLQWQGLQATLINGAIPVVETIVENWDKVEAGAIALSAVIGTRLALSFGIAGTQAALSLIQYGRYQVALARMAGETITLATATRGLSGAMLGLMGGPLGLIALGIQVTIAGGTYYAMTRKTNEATIAFDEQGVSLDGLIGKYKTLNTLQRDNETKALSDQFDDLRTKFVVASSDLSAFMEALPISDEKIATYTKLAQEFRSGKLSSDAFYLSVKNVNGMTDDQLQKVRSLINVYGESKTKYDQVKVAQDALKKSADQVNNSQKAQISLVNESAKAWQSLTQTQREYITQLKQDGLRDSYIKELVNRGVGVDKANVLADAQSKANGANAFKQALPQAVVDAAIKNFNSKNYSFSANDNKKLMGAVALVAKDKLEEVAKTRGLPAGLITGLIATESGGDINAKSPTGAKGFLQTTQGFRNQYGLTIADNFKDTAKVTAAASDDLAKNFKKYGNWLDAIMAYNGGTGGVDALKEGRISEKVTARGGYQKIDGVGYLSPAKAKEMQDHAQRVMKYMAGANSKTTIDTSLMMPTQADQLSQEIALIQSQKDMDEKRKKIDAQYYKESEKLAEEHKDRVEAINNAYAGTKELKVRLAQESALYLDQTTKLRVQREEDYANLTAFETDRIKQLEDYYSRQIELAKTNTELNDKERAKEISALQRKRDFEISEVRREQQEQVQSAFEAYMNETEIVLKRYKRERDAIKENHELAKEYRDELLRAKDMDIASVLTKNTQSIDDIRWQNLEAIVERNNPNSAARMGLENSRLGAQENLDSKYREQRTGIFETVDDETARNEKLLAVHEQYLQAKALLDQNYAQAELQLRQNQAFTAVQTTTDMMASIFGEQSTAYKAMFEMQRAYAVAQVLMNAPTTFSNVYTSVSQIPLVGWLMAPLLAGAAVGLQLAQAAKVGSISVAGFATGGHITGPGTGTSDDIPIWASNGEFMLKAAAVQKIGLDNLNYMNQTGKLPNMYADGGLIAPEKYLSTKDIPEAKSSSGRSSSSGSTGDTYHLTASFIDTKDADRWLKKRGKALANGLKEYNRNFGK